jgi:hypothetical protein
MNISGPIAVTAAVLLCLLLTVPALLAFVRQRVPPATTVFYSVLLLGLMTYHGGFGFIPPSARAVSVSPEGGQVDPARCEQAITVAKRAGLIIESGARLVVNEDLWQQVPEPVQKALTQCAASARPGGAQQPVEVIKKKLP